MVNFPLVYKIIGSLLFLLGTMLGLCVAISLYYGEDDMMAFLISTIFTVIFSFIFTILTVITVFTVILFITTIRTLITLRIYKYITISIFINIPQALSYVKIISVCSFTNSFTQHLKEI